MHRVCMTHDEVVSIVENLYGLNVTHFTKLNSYDDVNLHVYVKSVSCNSNIPIVSSDGYVLKILNSLDSKKVNFLEAMHAAIFRCSAAGILTPRPIPNINGDYFSLEELQTSTVTEELAKADNKEGQKLPFIVRLFEYLPGDLLQGKPCSEQLCYSVGEMAAKLDKSMMGFYHPGYDGHARHWCLSKVETLLDKVDAVENEEDRSLITDIVSKFKTNVVDNYHKLQKGIIHGDLNDQNILVKLAEERSQLPIPKNSADTHQTKQKNKVYCVNGVLDFGDSVYRYHIFEIAIAIMYMMGLNDNLDLVDVGGVTLAGYLSELELPTFDLSILKECVCGRFAQSLVYGAYEYKMDPSNTYCLQTQSKGWPLLRHLWKIPKIQLHEKWQVSLDKYNVNVNLLT